MGIPNTVTKIINKHGAVVKFEREKIEHSIANTIIDIEKSRRRAPELRARKYAELIAGRLYRDFYDPAALKQKFATMYLSYKPEERHRRLENARVTTRLAFALRELFLAGKTATTSPATTAEFVAAEFAGFALQPSSDETPAAALTAEQRADMIAFLAAKTAEMVSREATNELMYPGREDVQDTVETTLREIGEVEIAEAYMLFREGKIKIRSGDISPAQFTNDGIHRERLGQTIAWNIEHECDSVFALNDWVYGRNGKHLPDLVAASEQRYRDAVVGAARQIIARKHELRVIIIAGPSCSNKTTTTVIIGQVLERAGLKLKQLNIDNYFYDLAQQPKDEFGDYDFEMPEAIDIPLLNEHLDLLMQGKPIDMPHYNFKLGYRDKTIPFALKSDEILLIDCLHGLFSKLTAAVPMKKKFRIYIESMNVIRGITGEPTRWSDIRMLKRMIRDFSHRGYQPESTLPHWPYVRKGELKHIIPYIYTADAVINSGLPYELAALKTALAEIIPSRAFIEGLRQQGRLDPYIRGIRVHTLLETVAGFPTLEVIPPTSPIREFIGGSVYEIPHNE